MSASDSLPRGGADMSASDSPPREGAVGSATEPPTEPPTGGATDRDRSWTVLELLRWTTDYFRRAGIETARLDAELLLAHALETERLRLYVNYEKPVLAVERERYRALVQRRAQARVPVSQLLGEREFWSLPFQVTSDVLTPRPETETLVEWALSKTTDFDISHGVAGGAGARLRIFDLGTGSGAVALALASELPGAEIVASDLSPAALQIATQNADVLRTRERIRFVEGDLFEPVSGERFDLIVSNPPYVARSAEGSLPPELSHEPEVALFAGADGLDVIRRLVAQAGDHLSEGGWLGVELSPEQTEEVEHLLSKAGFVDIERRFDLASRPRVLGARWRGI
jgi:release factor glutamine methyltransferase